LLLQSKHDHCQAVPIREDAVQLALAPSENMVLIRGALPENIYEPPVRGKKILLTHFMQSVCRAINYPGFCKPREIHRLESYAFTDPKFSGFIRYEITFDQPARLLVITDAYRRL